MENKITITDATTGETIEREMTTAEAKKHKTMIEDFIKEQTAAKAEFDKLKEIKKSAYTKLGLTEEEIEALLPTPKPAIDPQPSA